jgi:hypothetical protein
MKGFGDTRDNVPAILELAEGGVLPLSRAVATMTSNVARRENTTMGAAKLARMGHRKLRRGTRKANLYF